MDKFFPGGLTYAGHPLACASAVASIEAYQEEGVVENAAEVGAYLANGLRALAERHPSIGDVRGLGCFWGVELVKNRETREMLVPYNASGEAAAPVARLAKAALERGLYLMTHWNVIMVVPPLTVTREEVDEGLAVLDEALAIADEYATLALEERANCGRGLVERVPQHGVPARDDDDLEQIAERFSVRVQQVVVREVRALAEHEQRRDAHLLEGRRLGGHLPVGRDDCGLAVAIPVAAVVVQTR